MTPLTGEQLPLLQLGVDPSSSQNFLYHHFGSSTAAGLSMGTDSLGVTLNARLPSDPLRE